MKHPEELLKKNVAGYSVVMFALDTLGLPRWNTILTTIHEDFDKEVIRLTKELPHVCQEQKRQTNGVSLYGICPFPAPTL